MSGSLDPQAVHISDAVGLSVLSISDAIDSSGLERAESYTRLAQRSNTAGDENRGGMVSRYATVGMRGGVSGSHGTKCKYFDPWVT